MQTISIDPPTFNIPPPMFNTPFSHISGSNIDNKNHMPTKTTSSAFELSPIIILPKALTLKRTIPGKPAQYVDKNTTPTPPSSTDLADQQRVTTRLPCLYNVNIPQTTINNTYQARLPCVAARNLPIQSRKPPWQRQKVANQPIRYAW